MGRPINSRFFGDSTGGDGFQITGIADFGAGPVTCYIIRQKSSHRFEVQEAGQPAPGELRTLTDAVLAANDGFFHILVNGAEHAKNIKAHQVSTFEGNGYVWSDITKEATVVDDAVDADLGDDVDVNPAP